MEKQQATAKKMLTETPHWSVVSEVELTYKPKVKAADRPQIKCSKDSYEVLIHLWNRNTLELFEEFKVLLLNRSNRVLGVYHLSKGGLYGTVADVRLIFAAALKAACAGFVLAHNHPSGNLKPSRMDEEITQKIQQAGQVMDIKVFDHLILTADGYFSFADEGLL